MFRWRIKTDGEAMKKALRKRDQHIRGRRYPQQDSNLRFRLRRPTLYPLSYGGLNENDYSTGMGTKQKLPGDSAATAAQKRSRAKVRHCQPCPTLAQSDKNLPQKARDLSDSPYTVTIATDTPESPRPTRRSKPPGPLCRRRATEAADIPTAERRARLKLALPMPNPTVRRVAKRR